MYHLPKSLTSNLAHTHTHTHTNTKQAVHEDGQQLEASSITFAATERTDEGYFTFGHELGVAGNWLPVIVNVSTVRLPVLMTSKRHNNFFCLFLVILMLSCDVRACRCHLPYNSKSVRTILQGIQLGLHLLRDNLLECGDTERRIILNWISISV